MGFKAFKVYLPLKEWCYQKILFQINFVYPSSMTKVIVVYPNEEECSVIFIMLCESGCPRLESISAFLWSHITAWTLSVAVVLSVAQFPSLIAFGFKIQAK